MPREVSSLASLNTGMRGHRGPGWASTHKGNKKKKIAAQPKPSDFKTVSQTRNAAVSINPPGYDPYKNTVGRTPKPGAYNVPKSYNQLIANQQGMPWQAKAAIIGASTAASLAAMKALYNRVPVQPTPLLQYKPLALPAGPPNLQSTVSPYRVSGAIPRPGLQPEMGGIGGPMGGGVLGVGAPGAAVGQMLSPELERAFTEFQRKYGKTPQQIYAESIDKTRFPTFESWYQAMQAAGEL